MTSAQHTGRVAVVTGASSGIGEATARALAADGHRVALLARRADRIQTLAAELGNGAIAIEADVTDRVSIVAAAEHVQRELGGADILVNNAGVMLTAPFGSDQREEHRRMVETNLLGAMTATEVFLDQLRAGGGDLVNVSSVAGRVAPAGFAAYAATKWGINGWSEALRVELQPDIRVTVIEPGAITTELTDHITDPASKRANKTATAEMGIPAQDIADVIAFAVSRPQRAQRDPRTPHRAGHVSEERTMNPVYDFKGQVALVTGASSGMGLAAAEAFAEAGAAVVLADINKDALRTATDELTSAGHQAIGVTCDVADEAQAAGMVDRTVATFGRLDMAFNNAGIVGYTSDLAVESAESFDDVTAVNLRGVWTCMKHELLHMRTQESGAIVNCSSLVGGAGRASYHAAQARRDRPDQERGDGLRAARHPHQRRVPRPDRHTHGQGHDREPARNDEGVHARPADRSRRPRRRGRGGNSLALQPRRELRARRGAAGRRRLRCALRRGGA
jgi:NADP-dependent 3-hydroxy acid dehydrogenase YdfG